MWIFNRLKYKYYDIKSWIKGKSFQLIHGFDYRDCWALDRSISLWLLPRLRHLKKIKQGIPTSCFEGMSLEEQGSDVGMKIAEERWNFILGEIIWSFQYLLDEDDIELKVCYPEDYDFGFETDGCSKLIWNDDRKPDFDKLKPYTERYERGMKLFAEHFRELWD